MLESPEKKISISHFSFQQAPETFYSFFFGLNYLILKKITAILCSLGLKSVFTNPPDPNFVTFPILLTLVMGNVEKKTLILNFNVCLPEMYVI